MRSLSCFMAHLIFTQIYHFFYVISWLCSCLLCCCIKTGNGLEFYISGHWLEHCKLSLHQTLKMAFHPFTFSGILLGIQVSSLRFCIRSLSIKLTLPGKILSMQSFMLRYI